MDKVTASYMMPTASFSSHSMPTQVRGHHSSISKAVDAHRQMVEERTSRQSFRKLDSGSPSLSFNGDDIQVQNMADDSVSGNDVNQYMEHEMIDPASGPAKLAIVQAFQTSEPGRPIPGEPMPKGSYLDVEA